MDAIEELRREFDAIQLENINLKESMLSRAIALDDMQWKSLLDFSDNNDGLTLDSLHSLSEKLRELAGSNPWHINGAKLRHTYVFGRGMTFTGVKPAAQAVIDDPHNKEALFSIDGYEQANLSLFTDGQFIAFYNTRSKKFTVVPLSQITATINDPDDDSDIWFVKRSWTANGKQREEWVPTARYKRNNKVSTTINNRESVLPDTVAYIKRSKRQTGWTWGVPDSLGAMIWTLAYSAYLQNNAKLVEALSRFAWTITQKTTTGVANAAAQVVGPGVGGTAVGAEGQALASVGVPSAQVNMNNGQPLIAAVAAALGVPVIALMSSPGATGGSYGAATTLDTPTIKGFEALQDSWKTWYEEILHDLGSKNAEVTFPILETDAPYRQMTTLAQAVELGLVWRDEARDLALSIMDLKKLHGDLPPLPDLPDKSGTIVSKQGVSASGPTGSTTNPQGDTNHDGDNGQ